MSEEESDKMEKPKFSYGQRAVGLKFNPSGDETVNKLKTLYAEIIDICNDFRPADSEMSSDMARLLKIAITEAQGAQMWAVKAVTFN